jgi:hypothetical protein
VSLFFEPPSLDEAAAVVVVVEAVVVSAGLGAEGVSDFDDVPPVLPDDAARESLM